MLFVLLTRILLWLLILVIAFFLLTRFIPQVVLKTLGLLLIVVFIVLIFVEPTDEVAQIAWEVFSIPLTPLGLSLILLGNGIRLFGDSDNLGGRLSLIAAFLILLLLSVPLISYNLARELEEDAIFLAVNARDRVADAIVLLGWDTTQPITEGENDREVRLSPRGDRLIQTARLYREGRARQVIVSAGPRPGEGGDNSEARDVRDLLASLGVPPESVVLEEESTTIRRSAEEVREILDDRGLSRQVLLVAPAVHAYRAVQSFRQEGMEAVPAPTDFTRAIDVDIDGEDDEDDFDLGVEDIVPDVRALSVSTEIIKEYLATIYYFLRGWLTPAELCRDCNESSVRPPLAGDGRAESPQAEIESSRDPTPDIGAIATDGRFGV